MINNNQDLFKEIKEIIDFCNASDQINYGNMLKEAMSFSSSPTEILGEIRLVIMEILNKEFTIEIKKKLIESKSYIEAVLCKKM